MFRGSVRLDSPMLFALGFLVCFLLGGLHGCHAGRSRRSTSSSTTPTSSWPTSTTSSSGVRCSPPSAAIHYWFPKFTGKKLDERLAKITFVLMFIGFNLTFFPQHDLGLRGMQRRIAVYPSGAGLETSSTCCRRSGLSSLAFSILPFLFNVWVTLRNGQEGWPQPLGRHDPRVGDRVASGWSTTSSSSPRSAPSGRCGTSTIPSTARCRTAGTRTSLLACGGRGLRPTPTGRRPGHAQRPRQGAPRHRRRPRLTGGSSDGG